jgi:DNA-binding response OmpR family regulator
MTPMIRVLVIDDDASIRLVLQRNLEYAGFEVLTAEDGATGIEAVRQNLPDVVILDLMMPQIDGYDVLEALRGDARTSEVPVLVLTALTSLAVKERCHRAGATLVMTKPFEPTSLASQIEGILEARQGSARVD